MPTFLCFLNWTDQGAKNAKDANKRFQASKNVAEKLRGKLLSAYVTTGQYDVVLLWICLMARRWRSSRALSPAQAMRGPRLCVVTRLMSSASLLPKPRSSRQSVPESFLSRADEVIA